MAGKPVKRTQESGADYRAVFGDVAHIIEAARRSAARSVNSVMTAAYWLIGRRIVEFEQSGKKRAEYGEALIKRLAGDLSDRYGRGFSVRNVWQMKAFYLGWPIPQTTSAESKDHEILQTVSAESSLVAIAGRFPLPWSAYVRLLSVNYPTLKLLGLSFQLQAKLCSTDDDRLVEAALDAITFAALKSAFSI